MSLHQYLLAPSHYCLVLVQQMLHRPRDERQCNDAGMPTPGRLNHASNDSGCAEVLAEISVQSLCHAALKAMHPVPQVFRSETAPANSMETENFVNTNSMSCTAHIAADGFRVLLRV